MKFKNIDTSNIFITSRFWLIVSDTKIFKNFMCKIYWPKQNGNWEWEYFVPSMFTLCLVQGCERPQNKKRGQNTEKSWKNSVKLGQKGQMWAEKKTRKFWQQKKRKSAEKRNSHIPGLSLCASFVCVISQSFQTQKCEITCMCSRIKMLIFLLSLKKIL